MKLSKIRHWSLYAYLFGAVFLVDRITKWYAVNLEEPYSVTSWLSCDLVFNRGISTGLFHSPEHSTFIAVSFLILLITGGVAFYGITRLRHGHTIWGETLIVAGSLSNLLDRMLYGGVVDFVVVHCREWVFPVFNGADVAIVIGVFIMLIANYKDV